MTHRVTPVSVAISQRSLDEPRLVANDGNLPDAETAKPHPAVQASEGPNALVAAHFDFIWRLLRRFGVPPADVDDATQQVFIIAVNRLPSIEPGSERSFLYGTAIRVASTLRRNAARRRRWQGALPPDPTCDRPLADEDVERREALTLLDAALAAMPDELRRVFVLSNIEELPAPEVASLEGIPVGTVASRLRRARAAFAESVAALRARWIEKP